MLRSFTPGNGRKPFLSSLCLAAILGLFSGAGFRNESLPGMSERPTSVAPQADPGSDFVATPIPAAGVVALKPPPLLPTLSGPEGITPGRQRRGVVLPESRVRIERQAVLVSAQVLEKYLPFRESLTSP